MNRPVDTNEIISRMIAAEFTPDKQEPTMTTTNKQTIAEQIAEQFGRDDYDALMNACKNKCTRSSVSMRNGYCDYHFSDESNITIWPRRDIVLVCRDSDTQETERAPVSKTPRQIRTEIINNIMRHYPNITRAQARRCQTWVNGPVNGELSVNVGRYQSHNSFSVDFEFKVYTR